MSLRTRALSSLLAVFAVLLVSLPAESRADVVHLKDGRKIEGKIVEETRAIVVLETRFGGKRRIQQDSILRIERKKTAYEEYESRVKRLRDDDAEGWFELGTWCKEAGLAVESVEALNKVIEMDSEHAGAREALGYVNRDGRWLTPAEAEAVDREAAEAGGRSSSNRAAGLSLDGGFLEDAGFIRFRDQWVTLKEKERLQSGMVSCMGRFVSARECEKIRAGEVKVDGEWMPSERADAVHNTWDRAWEVKTMHYDIKSDWPRARIDSMTRLLEANFREYARLIGGPPKKRLKVYAFRQRPDYLDFLAANKLGKFEKSDAFFDARTGLVVAWSGESFELVERIIGGVASWQYFKFSYDSAMPGWLSEGISIYFRRFGFDGDGKYVRAKPDRARLETILRARETDNLVPLSDLIRLEIFAVKDKGMTKIFTAQSWALFNYLIEIADENTRREFFAFMDELRNTFFVMGNAEFIAAQMLEDRLGEQGMAALEKAYIEAAVQLAADEGLTEDE